MHSKLIIIAKQHIKKNRSSKNIIVRWFAAILESLWNMCQATIRVCTDKEYRNDIFMKVLNGKNVHQTTPLTFMNRYPKIFTACQEYFKGREDLKILSYGCSTGEEVLTLRRYFPNSKIIGTDINKQSLNTCRKLQVDENINFIYSSQKEIQKHGKFDAIFCMAVLQRKPHDIAAMGITNLKKIYPFEKFEKQIISLDNLVKPNGLLIVHFTQYSLLDTRVAHKYKPLGNYVQDDYTTPVFDRNSEIIKNPNPQKSVFIKLNA